MKFYTSITRYQNDILYRGVEDGKRTFFRERFQPTLYRKNPKSDFNLRTIEGQKVSPVEFSTMGDASRYIKNNQTDDGVIQGNTNYLAQFIYNEFPEAEIQYNFDDICINYTDIETTCEDGFPNVDDPVEQITAITSWDSIEKVYYVFTHLEVTGAKGNLQFDLSDPKNRQQKEIKKLKIKHKVAKNEREMLLDFYAYWKSVYPDIISGWNNKFFDIPYLVNRSMKILGEEYGHALSPWNKVDRREVEDEFKNIKTTYVIYGVNTLDYLNIYKKFHAGGKKASYKLDFIANAELGHGKVSFDEFGAMHLFYKEDYKKFVEYNIVDVVLLVELEEKLRMMELAVFMAFWARVNFEHIHSPVRMIESICFNHMLNKGIVFPPMHNQTKTRQNKGAHVKEPVPGKYEWVVSVDATSLYPSIVMQQNISPECLVEDGYVETSINALLKKETDLDNLADLHETLCANGWKFRTDKAGILPDVIEKLFAARKANKAEMLKAERAAQVEGISAKEKKRLEDLEGMYDIRQNALKILLNSFYGAFANEGFIFFDMRLAEAVTYTGQLAIRWAENAVNQYLQGVLKTDKDYVIAIDTDSLYITLDDLVQKVMPGEQDYQKITTFLDNVMKQKINPLLTNAHKDMGTYINSRKQCLDMKREVIASRGFWTGKKHYALNVYDKEGTRYAEPKLKLVGLETAKSSTPQMIRDALTEAIKITMTKDEQTLIDFTELTKKDYYSRPVEDIAYPRGVSELDKYAIGPNQFAKGTPVNSKASLIYNNMLKVHNVEHIYPAIKGGDKIKYVYLKKPNTARQSVIAFTDRMPPHFELEQYIDKDTMFDKQYVAPLEAIVKLAGWSVRPKPQTLDSLFV